MWIYQRVNFLNTGYYSYLGANTRVGKYTEELDTDNGQLYIGYCSHLGANCIVVQTL